MRAFSLRAAPVHHRAAAGCSCSCRTWSASTSMARQAARLPGSKMIPAGHALRAVAGPQALVDRAQEPRHGPGGRRGLGAVRRAERHPQEELPLGVLLADRSRARRCGCWPPGTRTSRASRLFPGRVLQSRLPLRALLRRASRASSGTTSSMRSRRQPSVLVFLAQDADTPRLLLLQRRSPQGRGGRGGLPLHRLLEAHPRRRCPAHLVFDSKLTTYAGLARLDEMGIPFITLRRRSPKLLQGDRAAAPLGLAHRRAGRAHPQVPHPARLRADRHAGRAAASASCSSRTSATRNRPSC